MTASRSVPLLALSPYKRPLKQLGPSSHMVTLAPPSPSPRPRPGPSPSPSRNPNPNPSLSYNPSPSHSPTLTLALTLTRSCSRAGNLPRGLRASAASSAAAAVAAAAAAAAVVAAATAGCVARRRRAEPHAPYPSCHQQLRRRRRQQERRQAAAAAALVTNRTCSIGSARLHVIRSCGRVEPPPAGVVRARSVARASQTHGPTDPTDRGWPQKVGRGPQTVPTPRRPDTTDKGTRNVVLVVTWSDNLLIVAVIIWIFAGRDNCAVIPAPGAKLSHNTLATAL